MPEGNGDSPQDTSAELDDLPIDDEKNTVGGADDPAGQVAQQHDSVPTQPATLTETSGVDSGRLGTDLLSPARRTDTGPAAATTQEATTTELLTRDAVHTADATTAAPDVVTSSAVTPLVAPSAVAPDPVGALLAIPRAFVQMAASMISVALAPFLTPANPAAPAQPPLLWAVLAWVRREIEHTFFNSSPTLSYDPAANLQNNGDVVLTGDLNPSDPDGDPVSVRLVEGPQNGSVEVAADGTFTYSPSAAMAAAGGTDSFAVAVADTGFHLHGLLGFFRPGGGHTTTATIEVTFDSVNAAPGVDVTDVNTDPSTGTVTGRLTVDDADGDTTVVPGTITSTKLGTVTVEEDGTFAYTPTDDIRHAAAVTGATAADTTDTFTVSYRYRELVYRQSVTVPVSPHNTAPSVGSSLSTGDDGSTTITLTVTDGDGDPVRIVVGSLENGVITGLPEDRTIVVSPDGGSTVTLQYVPDSDAEPGTDTVTLVVDDGHMNGQLTTTVAVTIESPNAAPVITEISAATPDSDTGAISGALSVIDDGGVSYTVDTPSHGEVSIDATGQFTYAPDLDYFATKAAGATDTFTVTVTDADGATTTRTITYTWAPTTRLEVIGDVEDLSDSSTLGGWAISPDGSTVYLNDGEPYVDFTLGIAQNIRVFHIDVDAAGNRTYTETDPIKVSGPIAKTNAIEVSPDGTKLYVQLVDEPGWWNVPQPAHLRVIDIATGRLDPTINVPLDVQFFDMALSGDGTLLYGGGPLAGSKLTVIDLATGDTAVIPAPLTTFIAVSPDGNTMYYTDVELEVVYQIDLDTGQSRIFSLTYGPLVVSPDGNRLYNFDSPGSLLVLDTSSGEIIQTIKDGLPDASALWAVSDGTVYATGYLGEIVALSPIQQPLGTITA